MTPAIYEKLRPLVDLAVSGFAAKYKDLSGLPSPSDASLIVDLGYYEKGFVSFLAYADFRPDDIESSSPPIPLAGVGLSLEELEDFAKQMSPLVERALR